MNERIEGSTNDLRRQIAQLKVVLREVGYNMDFFDPMKKTVFGAIQRRKPPGFDDTISRLIARQKQRGDFRDGSILKD